MKISSSQDPADLRIYNLPFAGVTSDKLARARLRHLKLELSQNPGVNKRFISWGVREFLPPMKKIITGLPRGTHLIVMPSTTGVNRIPALLADGMKKLRPDLEVVNSKDRLIRVDHFSESKVKDRPIDRLDDPRSFAIDDRILSYRDRLNGNSVIIDDSISTGDSAITLHRQLLLKGISARAIITAIAGDDYHVRHSDVDRLYRKIDAARPLGYSADELKRDLYTTFAGYPRSKIFRIERALKSSPNQQLHGRPDLIVHLVRNTSARLQKEGLGPGQMVARQREIDPTFSSAPVLKPVRSRKPKL